MGQKSEPIHIGAIIPKLLENIAKATQKREGEFMAAFTSTTALAALTALGGTAAVAGGATAAGIGMANAKKKKDWKKETLLRIRGEGIKAQQYAANAPNRAAEAARAETERQRRIRALAGGKTLLASNTSGKTLLGS